MSDCVDWWALMIYAFLQLNLEHNKVWKTEGTWMLCKATVPRKIFKDDAQSKFQ